MSDEHFITTENARAGFLRAVKSTPNSLRSYGYAIQFTKTGKTQCWYKYKRDAMAKIQALKNCPNS